MPSALVGSEWAHAHLPGDLPPALRDTVTSRVILGEPGNLPAPLHLARDPPLYGEVAAHRPAAGRRENTWTPALSFIAVVSSLLPWIRA